MNPFEQMQLQQTRRAFLGRAAMGVGATALASLMGPFVARAASKSVEKSQSDK